MKKLSLILCLLIMLPSLAFAGENWYLGLGGSAVLGTDSEIIEGQGPDDAVARLMLGYFVKPGQVLVGVSMVQPSQDEQKFALTGRVYNTPETDTVKFFGQVDFGSISTSGDNRFQLNLGIGAELKVPLVKNLFASGGLSNVSDFTANSAAAAQLAEVMIALKF